MEVEKCTPPPPHRKKKFPGGRASAYSYLPLRTPMPLKQSYEYAMTSSCTLLTDIYSFFLESVKLNSAKFHNKEM